MLIIHVLIWFIHTLVWVPLMLLGWVFIPIAAILGAYRKVKSRYYDKEIYSFTWPFMYVWGNEEDGVFAGEEFIGYPNWIRIIYWSAFRNPVNNLRFIKLFRCDVEPSKIKFKGSFTDPRQDDHKGKLWYYCWQGIHANFRIQFKLSGTIYRFWIGWKIYPSSIYGVQEYQRFGAGFAYQLKRVR